jgi:saccharopine dehydrogenase-like NADP-dependent oxidoreductase
MAMLDELRIFSDEPIGRTGLSPAALLQHLLEQRWVLGPEDKDLVVMWHRFRYAVQGRTTELHATLAVVGQDTTYTAMARTVGLPMAMGAKLLLNGGITERGVLLPLKPAIYDPILDELATLGIGFDEREV